MTTTLIKSKPFLKWAGSKHKLLPQISQYVPKEFGDYYEPFLGSGAMYFWLWNQGLIKQGAMLTDINDDLINCFERIKNQTSCVGEILSQLASCHCYEFYYAVRPNHQAGLSYKAAKFIYLNRTCYNGLYRVNQSGDFNVPIGRYKKPKIHQPDVLEAAATALKDSILGVCHYRQALKTTKAGDFVYLDPPYHPIKESSFKEYSKYPFKEKEQRELASVFYELVSAGVKVLLSNSDCEFIRELYGDYPMVSISRSGSMNSDPKKRGKVGEILVLGNC